MAGIRAIQSVGESLRLFLQSTYPQELQEAYPCTFQVLSSGQLSQFEDPTEASVAVTLFLYRVTVSEHARSGYQRGYTSPGRRPALPVELHWMLSVWASSPAAEHVVFAWAISQLEDMQLLDGSLLTPEGGWSESDTVQLLPEELRLEDLMRVWDALQPSYRLSASYVARVVPIDVYAPPAPPPIVTARIGIGAGPAEEGA